MAHETRSYSAFASFGAGTIAGASGTIIGHPFDSLKVRLQVGRQISSSSLSTNVNLAWIKQLYRGILPPVITTGAMQSINFAMYELTRVWLNKTIFNEPTQVSHLSSVFLSGCVSGVLVSAMSTPVSIVKIQQQVASEMGMISCIKDIYRKSGVRAFYRGYATVFILESPGRGAYMLTYESCKTMMAYLSDRTGRSLNDISLTTNDTGHRIFAAAMAGIFSWLIVYPFDVIKARMQLDFDRKIYSSTYNCVRATWKEGGIRSMYRGIMYTLIRAGPVAGTVLPVYEASRDFLARFQEK